MRRAGYDTIYKYISVMFLPEQHMCWWLAAIFNLACVSDFSESPLRVRKSRKPHRVPPPALTHHNNPGVLDVTQMQMSEESFRSSVWPPF